jgi:hypothetical protein
MAEFFSGGVMRKYVLVSLVSLSLTACHQYPPRECQGGSQIQVQMRAPFDDSSNRSIVVAQGESIKGTFMPAGALRVDAVAVQIGNGGGAADGELRIKLCQDGKCVEGTAGVAGSKDNEYLEIRLTPNLPVTFEAGMISYELTRVSGTKEVVAWTYPGNARTTNMELKGVGTNEVLNLMFRQY